MTDLDTLLSTGPDTAQWSLWTMTARIVVTRRAALADARARAEEFLGEVERAGSRFRPDSELMLAQPVAGSADGIGVSPLLADLIEAALDAARRTDGAVDPTVGGWLHDLGYDRDLSELDQPTGTEPESIHKVVAQARPDWRAVQVVRTGEGARPTHSSQRRPQGDRPTHSSQRRPQGDQPRIPAGARLDLGATAKAYAADRCAAIIATEFDTGVLVSLGGDIATAGPAPAGGWRVLVQDRPVDPAQTIGLPAGAALATSSTVSRRWLHHGTAMHHIVDPRTGAPASTRWRSATVAAATCLQANAASTAALVHGDGAPGWLRRTGLPSRLVGADGRVTTIGAWPQDEKWPQDESRPGDEAARGAEGRS